MQRAEYCTLYIDMVSSKKLRMANANWSKLPFDLLKAITNQLGEVEDFVSFVGVCKSWRSAVPKHEWNPCVSQLPWLILAENSSSTSTTRRGFYNLTRSKRYDLNASETHGRRCWGSTIGWIFTVGMDLQTHLFNPLSQVQISLPPLTTFEKLPNCFHEKPPYSDLIRSRFVRRACVINGNGNRNRNRNSSSCTANDIVVMAMYGDYSYLALARPGYESWVSLQNDDIYYQDVVCFKDQIFAVQNDGCLGLCQIGGSDPPKISNYALPPEELVLDGLESFYLVESAGQLLMVVRDDEYMENHKDCEYYHKTVFFEVYKLDFSTRKWTKLFDLEDQALFLGSNYSMSVTATNLNCKSNSIYFADDNFFYWRNDARGGRDMGIFNMETETIEPYYLGDDCLSSFSPPSWVMPRFA